MTQTEEDTRSLTEVIIHAVILVPTTVFSLAGNSLVCLAFYRNRRLRIITNFYVLSLAVADIMMAALSFPFHTIASGLRRWPFNYNFCQFTGFAVLYGAQVSLCNLTMSSINRYVCVVKPHGCSEFFTRKKTIFSILFVWSSAFIELLTFTFATPVIYQWSSNSLHCEATPSDKGTERIFYMFFACFLILPMTLIILCYGSVYRVVRQHNTAIVPSLQAANTTEKISIQEIRASRVLFAAVLGFCICWVPFTVITILQFGFHVPIPSTAQSIYPLFSSFSAWINPIIYGMMNRAMRKEFLNIMRCRRD